MREITPPAGYLISDKEWHTEIVHRGEKEKQFVFKDAKYPEILIAKKDCASWYRQSCSRPEQ